MAEIAYQHKDITSKIFAESLKEKSFAVYGVNLPRIKEVFPTNLPQITANELRMDNLFLLEDGRLLIVDYESQYRPENMLKYANYLERVYRKYRKEYPDREIIMLVLYTSDVTRAQVKPVLDLGSLRIQIKAGFLSEIDSTKVLGQLQKKINRKEPLSDEEVMQLVILPLTVKGKRAKEKLLYQAVELSKNIIDENQQMETLAGIITFADKIVSRALSNQLKEWIKMTKVAQLFEEEKQEALKKQKVEVTIEVTKEVTKEVKRDIARKFKKSGIALEIIMDNTGLTKEEIEKL